MAVLALLLGATALLLVVSGAAKLRAPEATVPALAALGVPRRLRSLMAIRAGGCAEAAVGVAVLVGGGRVAAGLLVAAYATFLVVAVRLQVRAAGTGCGCFGVSSAPVGRTHVLVTAAGTAIGAAAAGLGASAPDYLQRQPAGTATAAALLVAALTAAGYVALTSWGETLRLARREARQ